MRLMFIMRNGNMKKNVTYIIKCNECMYVNMFTVEVLLGVLTRPE